MPKIIEGLRETILGIAEEQLKRESYGTLNMRSVAEAAGIAVGTLYNYFPNKEALIAGVLLKDWLLLLDLMREGCDTAESLSEAVLCIYEALCAYLEENRHIWADYSSSSAVPERHNTLVRQLEECLQVPVRRFRPEADVDFTLFLAENILLLVGNTRLTVQTLLRVLDLQ